MKEALYELSDEVIMHDEDLARHAFHQVGAYEVPFIPLYNQQTMGIRAASSTEPSKKTRAANTVLPNRATGNPRDQPHTIIDV